MLIKLNFNLFVNFIEFLFVKNPHVKSCFRFNIMFLSFKSKNI